VNKEEYPKFTQGLCFVCNKLVVINAQDETKGGWFEYKKMIRWEHPKCLKDILEGKNDAHKK
jgi:hypothetical protein